jgi:hypothetical protein
MSGRAASARVRQQTETPAKLTPSFDHVVMHGMSPEYVDRGKAWASSHAEVVLAVPAGRGKAKARQRSSRFTT